MSFERLKRYFESNDSKGNVKKLHKSWYFHFSIAIPLALSSVIALVIFLSSGGLSFCGTSECFDTALKLFKIPITTAGVALALGGIAAAVHRSIEAGHQIEMAGEQIRLGEKQLEEIIDNNKFSNFHKHREIVLESVNDICAKGGYLEGLDKSNIYSDLYGTSYKDFDVRGVHREICGDKLKDVGYLSRYLSLLLSTLDSYDFTCSYTLFRMDGDRFKDRAENDKEKIFCLYAKVSALLHKVSSDFMIYDDRFEFVKADYSLIDNRDNFFYIGDYFHNSLLCNRFIHGRLYALSADKVIKIAYIVVCIFYEMATYGLRVTSLMKYPLDVGHQKKIRMILPREFGG